MNQQDEPRKRQACFALLGVFGACLFLPAISVEATVFDWDNYSGSSAFVDSFNWRPTGGPPEMGDTALFDGQLENAGIGNNAVNVPNGTVIAAMRITNSAGFPATVVDMTIGDGTMASRLDLDQVVDSLIVGTSFGDTVTLNLLGGWLDTWDTTIGGRSIFNVVGAGSYWDSTSVLLAGDGGGTNIAGIGLGNQATIRSTSLEVGNDTSSGRVVIDGSFTGFGTPSLWTVAGSVAIGPPSAFTLDYGSVTLQSGGQMNVGQDINVHGGNWSSTLTVKTGGSLNVTGGLNIGQYGVLELFDPASTITTGDIDIDGRTAQLPDGTFIAPGGVFDWTGGTLHITDGRLRIDKSSFADLDIDSLTIDAGMSLKVTRVTGGSDSLTIGNVSEGSMTVQNGGEVESYHGYIGEAGGAVGTVLVDGTSSRWTVTEDLAVGYTGTGEGWLTISNGGRVEANSIWLGRTDSTQGTAYVLGTNSTLTSRAALAVGGFVLDSGHGGVAGGTGTLYVEDGGRVDVGGLLKVWGAGTVSLDISGGSIRAGTIDLAPGATFITNPGTLVQVNSLVGFGDHPMFEGNLHIGHSGGSGFGGHAVGAGQTLTVNQSLAVGTDAEGALIITGGTVHSYGSFIGGETGSGGSYVTIDGPGSSWYANTIHVGGDGIAPQANATLNIANDAQAIVSDRIKVWGPGSLSLDNGVISTDFVEVEGLLTGNGAILLGGGPTSVTNRGVVAPGLSAGVLTINGNASSADAYVQEASGTLVVEIGGSSPAQYDQLNVVAGSATLDGVIDVALIDLSGGGNPFTPSGGDRFELVTADDGLGATRFASELLPPLPGGLAWNVLYGTNTVTLEVLLNSFLEGDFDEDGDVDGDDLLAWQTGFGMQGSAAHGDGDANADGNVDGNDFLLWQTQFGSTGGGAAVNTVPEPSAAVLACLGGLIAVRFRRREPVAIARRIILL